MAVEGSLTLLDVSRYVKKNGISRYSYPEAGGGTRYVPQDKAVIWSVVQYDISKVLKSVASEIERYTVPCKIGLVSDTVRAASFGIM